MSKSKATSGYKPLADQLREMIVASGLTTNALAVAAGVPQPVLHRWVVSGERANIRLDTADKLCEFFCVHLTRPRKRTTANRAQ